MEFKDALLVQLIGSAAGAFLGALLGYYLGLRAGANLWRNQTTAEAKLRRDALLLALQSELGRSMFTLGDFDANKMEFHRTIHLRAMDQLVRDAQVLSPELLEALVNTAARTGNYNDWVAMANSLQATMTPEGRRQLRENTELVYEAMTDARNRLVARIAGDRIAAGLDRPPA